MTGFTAHVGFAGWIQLVYVLVAALFVVGLHLMNSPATARRGNQVSMAGMIIAGIATFFISLLLWLLSWFTAFDSSVTSSVVSYLSIVTHFENFGKGVLDSKDVIFYLSLTYFSLFLTARSLESLRWRA